MANKNEAKILFTADTGKFNDGIAQAKSEMNKLRAEMTANKAEMKATGTTVEGLEKKHEILSEQYKVAQRETEAMSQKLAAAKKYFGENSIEANNLEAKLIKAQTAQASLGRAVQQAAEDLQQAKDAMRDTRTATEKLTDTVDDQQSKLDDLKGKYADVVLEYGKGSREAKDLAGQIDKLSAELKENKSKMSDAKGAADKLDRSLDDVGGGAEGAGGGFTVMKGALADLISQGIQAAIGKINEFVDYMWSLPEATREIRQDFSTLQTSFDNVGFTTEQASDTWKELYKVFGEDDRAVETANHIARIAKSEEDLNELVNITTGIWGTYQDSLPVEGLAEAISETVKVSQVTGVLADALNWGAAEGETYGVTMKKNIEFTKLSEKELGKLTKAQQAEYKTREEQYNAIEGYNKMVEEATSAEDYFNIALSNLSTEEERQAFIVETLSGLYGGAADTYRETEGAMMDAKDAAAEQILAENNLASAIEPVTTAWQSMKNELLVGILPTVEKVSDWAIDALEWMKEHPKLMQTIAITLGIVAGALSALAIGWGIYTAAQWLANAALFACPLTWIIAIIVAVAAAIAALIVYWDEITAAVGIAATATWEALKTAWQWIVDLFSSVGTWIYDNVIAPVAQFFVDLWTGIVNACTTAWNSILSFFSTIGTWIYDNVIAPVAQFFVNLWNGIVSAWHTVIDPWIEIVRRLSVMFYESVILPVAQFFTDLWNGIVLGLQTAWNWIVSLALTVAGWVNTNVIQPVVRFFTGLWNGIKNGASAAWNFIVGVYSKVSGWINEKVIQPVAQFFTKLWNGFTNGARKAWEGVKSVFSAVGGFFGKVFGIVKDKIVSVFQAGGKVFNNIKDGIVSVFKTVVNGIIRGINKVIKLPFEGLNKILDKIHGVSIVGVQPFSWLTWRAPIPSIPLLAEGGILTKPTLNIAGEAGAEAVIPLDRLQSFIDTAVDRSLQMNNLQALVAAVEDLADRAIELHINGRQFATATASDADSVNGNRLMLSRLGLALG